MRYSLMCLVLHVHQCISFPPLSTLSYREIEKQIRNEISSMKPVEKEDHLIGIAAQAKYDHQKTQHNLEVSKNESKIERDRAVVAEKDKDDFEAKFSDCSWTMCLRQVIDVYEDEFKKLELFIDCDEYGNSTAGHPKFKLNKAAVREILDYYDRQAEVRRQKWTFYGNNPPTSLFDSLIQRVKAGNMSVEDFAAGIAQGFKMLSLLFHQGFFKGAKTAFSVNLHMFETVNQALNIILANVNFAPSLFSYDNKTSCRPQVCDVGKQNFLNSTLL